MRPKERSARRRLAYHLERVMRAEAGIPARFDGCAQFQARVHLAATGTDAFARWRVRYRSLKGLKRQMPAGGFRRACFEFMRRRGWKRVDPKRARIGDLGLVALPNGALGFALVRKLHRDDWIGRNDTAWSMLKTKDVVAAWNVCAGHC